MINYISTNERKLRKRQRECTHMYEEHECIHCSFKCSLCGLYQDNLFSRQRHEISILNEIIDNLSTMLKDSEISHVIPSQDDINGIINVRVDEQRRQYDGYER